VAYFFGPLCISKAQEHCAQICSSAQNVRGMLIAQHKLLHV